MENVEFYVGKAEDVIPEWHAQHGARVDVMVVDPPRAGCDRTLLETMAAMAPERIVYVSCDPGTLAPGFGNSVPGAGSVYGGAGPGGGYVSGDGACGDGVFAFQT